MQLLYKDESNEFIEINGGFIKKIVIRSDLVPIPMTLEADIRVDEDSLHYFLEGSELQLGNGDQFTIIKSRLINSGNVQGRNVARFMSVIAVLTPLVNACFVRDRPIRRKNTTLAGVYRAIGCTFRSIEGDFAVPVYNCLVGEPPSFQIAQILQENAGVMSWRDGNLKIERVEELFKKEPILNMPLIRGEEIGSQFLARHEVPTFYSMDKNGNPIFGDQKKARTARYVPNKDLATLRNMSTCLVLKQVSRVAYKPNIIAGDLLRISADEKLAVITVAHVFSAGIDGDPPRQYSKLWLGELRK